MDIVIYTNPETLLHKRRPSYGCWWSMKRPPKKFNEGDKVYFAVKGEVQGCFICDDIEDWADSEWKLYFESNSWEQIDEIDVKYFCKPFRGFRYKWW